VATVRTDRDGRCAWLGPDRPAAGTYRLTFDTAADFTATGQTDFHPTVSVTCTLADPARLDHVPVLPSPFALAPDDFVAGDY
jgi:5-hydroxyisourate hydrolase